ncbi:hypothetical protein N0V84_000386 [Fusarium piperis]|uniref:Carboxylic ester hydrolase n=1 Tax=Fusarium piperis TaxID=1435070 RepID=A0A9W8WN21_9HYPO|nr:hypothetical protein N0V84_000386 [Fusarium piperis]
MSWILWLGALSAIVQAASLDSICSKSYAKAALPTGNLPPGINIDSSSLSAELFTNQTLSSDWFPTSTVDYCNITFAYSHNGIANDKVHVSYWIPAPNEFKNRYLSTGGGGFGINRGTEYAPSGIIAGAVSGQTDGGFGSFATNFNQVFLLANETINWQAVHMHGYQAHHELALIGKEFSRNLYNVPQDKKIYSYFQGCSEGGREGWSQVQRYADQFDGVVVGAPAFHYSQQQINLLFANVIEQTINYFPPTCELDKIMNLTIRACDALDGKTDGVVSRTDLCKLHFSIDDVVGEPYSCDAVEANGGLRNHLVKSTATPAQTGKVTAEAAKLVKTYLDGPHDSDGRRIYLTSQFGSDLTNAYPQYNKDTKSWELALVSLGSEWVARFLNLQDTSLLSDFDNVTYDTLRDWITLGLQKYSDTLQTNWPDIGPFQSAGGKILQLHGESDPGIPAGSSVYYYEAVRKLMYPSLGYNESVSKLDDFYRLFLIPGGDHCGPNSNQPGGGWPQNTLQTVIDWVENGEAPERLNSTGGIEEVCHWPLRPLWSKNGTAFECSYDQKSLDTWMYEFDAFKVPIF